MKKRKLVIDADSLLYQIYGPDDDDGELIEEDIDIEEGKEMFYELVQDIEDTIACTFMVRLKKNPVIAISDETNFRYDIYPAYKANRTQKMSPEFYALRDWARETFTVWKNCEADDICGWYAYHNTDKSIIASIDKDVLYGTPGMKFDYYHSRAHIINTTPWDAERFNLVQTLAGDPGDGIPGLPRVGQKTAEKILAAGGWQWQAVVDAYESKGLAEEDAILTRRLIGMDQLNKKKKLKLWRPKK